MRSDQLKPDDTDKSQLPDELYVPTLPLSAPEQQREEVQYTSTNSKADIVSSVNSSPRELISRVSSATEYDTLPRSMHDSKLSPNLSSQLALSPDLAERVSAILNPSKPYTIPHLSFDDGSEADHHSYERTTPKESQNDSNTERRRWYSPRGDSNDSSYLDKYIHNSSQTPRESDRRFVELELSSFSSKKSVEFLSIYFSFSADDDLAIRYMDKSSRQVLEQAAKEYYESIKGKCDSRSRSVNSLFPLIYACTDDMCMYMSNTQYRYDVDHSQCQRLLSVI